ncbi:MAG: sigma 54-interacting transcriptional regulator [Treponema sp.]|nr:sigma 54-interacting transcriptional regulator [Treponema sp.]MBD5409086.1 sigma 54-interacting transcriptional regulator [Treponema sp.]MBD5412342.1 sigma 54-interacting transcriptional regulator [Treponema sp.]MBD5414437.1 sigma 54-interacting transcriptional regulator [Treponema sp.]
MLESISPKAYLLTFREDVSHFCYNALKYNFDVRILPRQDQTIFDFNEKDFFNVSSLIIDISFFKSVGDVHRYFKRNEYEDCNVIAVLADGGNAAVIKEIKKQQIDVIKIPCEHVFFRNKIKCLSEKQDQYEANEMHISSRLDNFWGKSDRIAKIKRKLMDIAFDDSSILFEGESGTGKTLLAKTLYEISGRSMKKFVRVNSSVLKDEIAASELYGSTSGAYTGAVSKPGFFASADGGIIFFDEINNMKMSVQEDILMVLDSGRYYKVGSVVEQKTDVRVFSATNMDINDSLNKGLFRRDLFSRISDNVIKIPPLRERPEDIIEIMRKLFEKRDVHDVNLSEDAITFIMNFSWPANVRDLIRCTDFMIRKFRGKTVYADDISEWADEHHLY